MPELEFTSLGERYIPEIESWLDDSTAKSRFTEFYKSSEQWLDKEVGDQQNQAWVALTEGQAVGFFDIRVDQNNHAHLSFAVKPSERRQGIGKKIVERALALPELGQYSSLTASVEASNTGGRKLLEHSGFSFVGNDSDGNIELRKVAS